MIEWLTLENLNSIQRKNSHIFLGDDDISSSRPVADRPDDQSTISGRPVGR